MENLKDAMDLMDDTIGPEGASELELIKRYKARKKYEGTLDKPKLIPEGTTEEGSPAFCCENNIAWIRGCFSEKNPRRIYIWATISHFKGGFKPLMDHIVNHYKCNSVEFTNVIGYGLALAVHGFKLKKRYWKIAGEWIDNLIGKWEIKP